MASFWVAVNGQAGYTVPGTIDSPQLVPIGTVAVFRDIGSTQLGEGEFIYLAGVASTVLGSAVSYQVSDGTAQTGATTLWAGTANTGLSLAFATAATVAGTFGWYQIGGSAIAATSGTVAAADQLYWQATGVISHTAVTGKQVQNAQAASANGVPGTNQAIVTIDRPLSQGAATGTAASIVVGTTAISGGTTTRILYDNVGVLGEYTLTGSGTVAVMQTSPSLITPALGVASATSLTAAGTIAQTSGATFFLGTTATADTMTVAASPALTAYTAGAMYSFICGASNTGASTLNVNSLGAKAIVKRASTATAANDMLTNGVYIVIYDGTSLHLINPAVP